MTTTKSIPVKKILRFTERRRQEFVEVYLSWGPLRLASYYYDMGSNERRLVDENVFPLLSEQDKKYFEFYLDHPLEIRDALAKSELEQKAD